MGAYPAHWTVLQEPVPDIHSLLYYSCLVISSGDSMAREGAMLGVPSVYVGSRDMKANAMMQEKKMLFQCSVSQAPDLVDRILEKELTVPTQDEFRAQLRAEWDDITQLIVSQIDQDNDQIAISFR
jgi:predicted glycosyltransferase